jgi:hypothetical protein
LLAKQESVLQHQAMMDDEMKQSVAEIHQGETFILLMFHLTTLDQPQTKWIR